MKKQVLGIKIDDVNMKEAISIVDSWLTKSGKYYIVTPNPEFIVTASDDPIFKKILNEADLSIPDGAGLKLSGKIKNTLPGVDFMEALVKLAEKKGFTVGFLGGQKRVAERAVERLKKIYPKLKVSFALSDLPSSATGYRLPATSLLFVAFGHPKQEYWIAENLKKIPVKVSMGVGGAFDYIAGEVPRAPKWIRNLNLEWLFRLIIQPWRIKRQLRLIRFVMALIKN